MSSINDQQPESNHHDLRGAEALDAIRTLTKSAPTCFLCTAIRTGERVATRPMAVQEVDDDGCLWFLSANDSSQNRELVQDSAVQLMFQGSPHSEFLTLFGHATISVDRKKIDELWKPLMKVWFTEGKDDPRITLIKVTPSEGYYWDTKHNRAIAFAKMVIGAITGQTLDDSIEGTLRP